MYIDPEVLKRKPLIGVVIGLVGTIFFCLMGRVMFLEYQRLKALKTPVSTDIKSLHYPEANRSYISLVNGEWKCEWSVKQQRKFPERWIFGKIESTQIPITDGEGKTLVIAKFAGDVECARVANKPVTGVLMDNEQGVWGSMWGSHISIQFIRIPHEGKIWILHTDANAKTAGWYSLGCLGFVIIMVMFTSYYLKCYSAMREIHLQVPEHYHQMSDAGRKSIV